MWHFGLRPWRESNKLYKELLMREKKQFTLRDADEIISKLGYPSVTTDAFNLILIML
jgi:hypothetical protein